MGYPDDIPIQNSAILCILIHCTQNLAHGLQPNSNKYTPDSITRLHQSKKEKNALFRFQNVAKDIQQIGFITKDVTLNIIPHKGDTDPLNL